MDNIISRFPGLAERIFDSLDDENLVNSKTVSRSWSTFTENEVFYFRRIIKKLIGGYDEFNETWKLVMKKADMEMKKELALAVKSFLSKHPASGPCLDQINGNDCHHRAISFSPLHIGAEAGQVSLCEFILKITKDKNPKLNKWNEFYLEGIDLGWTPLHEAAQNGHLVICYMIMNEITDKNPGNANGYTPLHAAALGGQLETFKLIMNKVTDINPRDNEGWTPLHGAASYGHQELCKFIVDKVEDKNPEDDNGVTPHELMWNYICGTQYI